MEGNPNPNANPFFGNRKVSPKIFTKEEKAVRLNSLQEVKNNLNIVEFASNVLGLTIFKSKKGERYLKCKELSSLVFDLGINKVYWNKYSNKPMDIIEFVAKFNGYSHNAAIEDIVEYYKTRDPNVVELYQYDSIEDKSYISKGLTLPTPNVDDLSATNYLLETRRISEEVINYLKNENMLYEDIYHNCVFVGYDADKNARFGVRRGTDPSLKFQRDCEGSYKLCGLFIENKNPVKKIVLTECVIDGLSYLSLNWKTNDAHILCSSGAGSVVNTFWYNRNTRECLKDVEEIICACDNDEAGYHAYKQIEEYLKKNNLPIKLSVFNRYEGEEIQSGEDLNNLLIKVREKEDSFFISKDQPEDRHDIVNEYEEMEVE